MNAGSRFFRREAKPASHRRCGGACGSFEWRKHRVQNTGRRAAPRPYHGLPAEFERMAARVPRFASASLHSHYLLIIEAPEKATNRSTDMRLPILREMFVVCWTRSESIVRISSAIPWVARLRRNSFVNFRSGSPGLVLCATMCGGGRAIYAKASVLRVMRDLDGLGPEEIARRIWKVTYSPRYLADNTEKIEGQMLREIAEPTPLHAADLQFQAFSDFDCSDALPNVRAPTLVLTGDLDQLIPPGNSKTLAELIPGAELRILRGIAHRLMWEAAQDCAHVVSDFLREVDSERRALAPGRGSTRQLKAPVKTILSRCLWSNGKKHLNSPRDGPWS